MRQKHGKTRVYEEKIRKKGIRQQRSRSMLDGRRRVEVEAE